MFSNVGQEKTVFWAIQEAYFFRLFSGKNLKNFKKKFRKSPKIDFYGIFGRLFFKISENFSKTAPSAPFSGASRPKAAGLIRGSKAPLRVEASPLRTSGTYTFYQEWKLLSKNLPLNWLQMDSQNLSSLKMVSLWRRKLHHQNQGFNKGPRLKCCLNKKRPSLNMKTSKRRLLPWNVILIKVRTTQYDGSRLSSV